MHPGPRDIRQRAEAGPPGGVSATLYKNPGCECCSEYADYLRAHGMAVKVVPTPDLERMQRQSGVPDALAGCHLTRIGRYVFEGHVPVESIQRCSPSSAGSRVYPSPACPPVRPE